MFNKWLKFIYLKNGFCKNHYNSLCSRHHNFWNFAFYLQSNFAPFNFILCGYNSRFLFKHYVSTLSNYIKNSREETQFFSKHADHSKQIVKTLKNGYGKQQILGNRYILYIIFPKEPEVEDIGNGNSHLKSGYPELWELKNLLYANSGQRLQNMKEI